MLLLGAGRAFKDCKQQPCDTSDFCAWVPGYSHHGSSSVFTRLTATSFLYDYIAYCLHSSFSFSIYFLLLLCCVCVRQDSGIGRRIVPNSLGPYCSILSVDFTRTCVRSVYFAMVRAYCFPAPLK